MIGTLLNGSAILLATVIGLTSNWNLSPANQFRAKFLLGLFVVYAGLSATWNGVHGTFGQVFAQLVILVLSLILGNLTGKLLGIQRLMNRLGRYAKSILARAPEGRPPPGDGFITCAILFCVGPMALLGALQEGLTGSFRTLGVKAVMDGLATLAFARMFGWPAGLSALPVVAYQGTITLLARAALPFLNDHALVDSIAAMNGLLILCLSLIIFEIKKVEMGDYLPSLAIAPLLTWLWF